MNLNEFKDIVERICGPISKWTDPGHYEAPKGRLKFRLVNPLPIKTLMALSEALGTDEIDFNFGYSGTTHYSDLTPGEPGSPGWVEVVWPIKKPEALKTGVIMGPDFGDD